MNNKHTFYFQAAAEEAQKATCHKARCGAVIIAIDGSIIGRGYNAPAGEDESQRFCGQVFDTAKKPKYDKTCCVHAEWNAVLDACKARPQLLKGATLYFMRVDEVGNFTDAGQPYCTVCSRLALQSGLANFALWVNEEVKMYDTKKYNLESYGFHSQAG